MRPRPLLGRVGPPSLLYVGREYAYKYLFHLSLHIDEASGHQDHLLPSGSHLLQYRIRLRKREMVSCCIILRFVASQHECQA